MDSRGEARGTTTSRVLPGLQGADGVDLCHIDDGAHCFEGGAAAFSHLATIDMGCYHTVTHCGLGHLAIVCSYCKFPKLEYLSLNVRLNL